MKIESLTIENVKSFYKPGELTPNSGMNVFIGSNGGGKTTFLNLMRLLLLGHLVKQYEIFKQTDGREEIREVNLSDDAVSEKHFERPNETNSITIKIKATKEDIKNANILLANVKLIKKTFNEVQNMPSNVQNFFMNFKMFEEQTYEYVLKNNTISPTNDNFLLYLKNINLFSLLIERHNQSNNDNKIDELSIPIFYIPSTRKVHGEALVILADFDPANLLQQSITNPDQEHLFKLIKYRICSIYRKLRESDDEFKRHPKIKNLIENLGKIGFDFTLELKNDNKNAYKFIISKNKKKIEISKLSAGEQQLIYFVFLLSFSNVKNGVVLIDEPELHLHPTWQKLLLHVLYEISKDSQIQIFLVTHSANLIDVDTIKDIIRIYYDYDSDTSKFFKAPANSNNSFYHRFLNATNNEKVFFSDFVIVCEGICDKYVFSQFNLLKSISKNKVGELIEDGGVDKIDGIRKFLDAWKIKNYVIVDSNATCSDSTGAYRLKRVDISEYFGFGKDNKPLSKFIDYFQNGDEFPEDLKNELNVIIQQITSDLD